MLTFVVRTFWLILGLLTFAKFVEFLNRSTDNVNLNVYSFFPASNFNENRPTYAYRFYAYRKGQEAVI